MNPYRLPRNFILVFLLIIVLIVGGGAWFYLEQRELLKENINDDLMTIAQAKVEMIDAWRRDQILEGIELAKNQYLIQDLSDWQETQNPEIAAKIISYLQTIQSHYGYSDIAFVSSKGQPLLSLGKELEPIDGEAISALNEAMKMNETRLTDLHIGSHDQNPHISVIVPLVRQENEKQTQFGALILINDARDFLYPLIQSWPTQSITAETLLVERDGDSVVFLNELRHQKDTAFKLRFDLTETQIPAVQAVLGKEGIFIGQDYRGVNVLSALMPIPDSPWFMVAKIDTSEALAVWRTNATLIGGMLLGIIGVFAAAAVVYWQREEKRHYFRLAALESARRESEASHLVTLMSVGDGVIVTDKFGFIQLINPVAESLTGWSHAKAKGKLLEKVFRIINEETQEKVENPVEKVIRAGLVVGLANHTLLVARDGSRHPIADSGAPIRNDKGEISGVVLVFRDQSDERKSHQELVESEKKFRTYFNSTPTAITLYDTEGKYIMVNPAFCDLVGYSQEELLKKGVADFTHPDDLDGYNDRVRTMLSGIKIAYMIEKRILRKDDSVIWVEGNTNLIRDDAGKPLFFLSNMSNITERKLAEEKLRESEEKFRRYFEDATIGISLTETTGKLTTINKAFCDMLGYSFEELSTKGFAEITHPDDLDKSKECVRCLLAGEKSTYRMDKRYIKKDGSVLWVDVSTMLLRDSAGQPLHFITNVIDITDRRLFQRTLEEKEAYIKNVLDNLPVGVSVNSADPTVSFSYVNDNFVKFYRTTRESLSKVDSFWDAVYEDPKFRAEIKKRVLDDCASGDPDLMHWDDIPIIRKGQETTYVTARNIPIDENRLMVSIVWDTTVRKKAEDQIRKMNEELEKHVDERTKQLKKAQEQLIRQERLAVLGQLAGGVSHELRNPLGVISNAAYYLGVMLPKADQKTKEYITIIDSETHRAEKIITDLLDFSRVKTAERETFNLEKLVYDAQNHLKKPENIMIEMNFPESLPAVFADPSQITLVIGNLLENAYQAMPEGGVLTLTGKEKILKKKPYVSLEVQDTGSGITPENLDRIFEPLFTTKQRGIGLGLATSKNLVESNGGTMTVNSEAGKGSLFTVALPSEKTRQAIK